MREFYVYMVLCDDGSYYVGITNDAERRVAEHNAGLNPRSYTFTRRPVSLAYCGGFADPESAIAFEKQLKGWSRAKKRALSNGDWKGVRDIVRSERQRRATRSKPC